MRRLARSATTLENLDWLVLIDDTLAGDPLLLASIVASRRWRPFGTHAHAWLITWTADADAVRGYTWWLTAPVNTSATPVPDSSPIQFSTTEPGSATWRA